MRTVNLDRDTHIERTIVDRFLCDYYLPRQQDQQQEDQQQQQTEDYALLDLDHQLSPYISPPPPLSPAPHQQVSMTLCVYHDKEEVLSSPSGHYMYG